MAKNCHAFTAMESSEKTKTYKKKKPKTNHKQELTNMSPVRNDESFFPAF